ncbi:hypothetical protein L596_004302 [Steinernema carpocapsae]|uniref:JmjC domain-containing protein n=2 Tax=Steinernema carpocapsae TaxID=34508 RepID=A0A4V6I896_STECR|nr:hypothetical protein L596_004302 [Steinernema carpocapsae]
MVHTHEVEHKVYYGADIKTDEFGSGFPRLTEGGTDIYTEHPWNLNNISTHEDSVLQFVGQRVSGMTVPWLYVGMCFSSFCWHVEDHWTYSVNYQHTGAAKVWYGVAEQHADQMDKFTKQLCPEVARLHPDLNHHMTAMIDPNMLRAAGIAVFTVHQEPGEFVITLPRAYHSGFNTGFNVNEAVNFAPIEWLRHGYLCSKQYARVGRQCVFAFDELIMRMVETLLQHKWKRAESAQVLPLLTKTARRETAGRQRLAKLGVKKLNHLKFETVKDDHRSCGRCATTLFHSSVECTKHPGPQVCMEHVGQLCLECSPKNFVLNFRYSNEAFGDMLKKLEQMAGVALTWLEKINKFNKEIKLKNQPLLESAQRLIDEGEIRKLPVTREVALLKHHIDNTRNLVAMIYNSQGSARGSKSFKMLDPDQLETYVCQLNSGPLRPSSQLLEVGGERVRRALAWIKDVKELRTSETIPEKFEREARSLLKEADNLVLNFSAFGYDYLSNTKKIDQWGHSEHCDELQLVTKIDLNFANMQSLMKYMDPKVQSELFKKKEILKHLQYSKQCGVFKSHQPTIISMTKQLEEAKDAEKKCEKFFSKIGVSRAEAMELWAQVRKSSWLDCEWINRMRREVCYSECVRRLTLCLVDKGPVEPNLRMANDLDKAFKCSIVLQSEVQFHGSRIAAFRTKVEQFVNRVQSLFMHESTYYSLYDIIGGREDVSDLAEGKILPLSLQTYKTHITELESFYQYNYSAQLYRHFELVYGPLVDLLKVVQKVNSGREFHMTCHCGRYQVIDGSALTCFLCRSTFHPQCVRWNSTQKTLPTGIFLCQRCQRGKRPAIGQVVGLLDEFDYLAHTLEHRAVQWLRNYALTVCHKLGAALIRSRKVQTYEEFAQVTDLLLKYFSMECYSPRIQSLLENHPYFDRMWPMRKQAQQHLDEAYTKFEKAKEWAPFEKLWERTFPPVDRRKKSAKTAESDDEDSYESEDEFEGMDDFGFPIIRMCQHKRCLKPFGNSVGWVQCNGKSCKKWFHYVCVDVTIYTLKKIMNWFCPSCHKRK